MSQKTKLGLEGYIKLLFNNIEVAQLPQSNVYVVALKILKKFFLLELILCSVYAIICYCDWGIFFKVSI